MQADIVVLPGDGIGAEVTAAAVAPVARGVVVVIATRGGDDGQRQQCGERLVPASLHHPFVLLSWNA